jgi:thiol-disulfide isomerase/thioredoxin
MHRLLTALLLLSAASIAAAAEPSATLPPGTNPPSLGALHLLDGTATPSWQQLKGKVVVLDFWATWCGPCVGSIPKMNQLEKEFAGQPVRFLSVTYEPAAKVRSFLEQHPMGSTVALDPDLATFVSWKAWGIPQIYLVGPSGKVIAVVHPNKLSAEVLRQALAGQPITVGQHPGWPKAAEAEGYFRSLLEEDRKKWGR